MKIRLTNSWAHVVAASDEELRWLDSYLSVSVPAFTQSRSEAGTKTSFALGVSKLLNQTESVPYFPAGLALRSFRSNAAGAGVEVELIDARTRPCEPVGASERDALLDRFPDGRAWLRPYQREAVEAFLRRGGRGLIKVPTGGGKTEVFIGLSRVLPCEWLFIVHRASLTQQTADRYALRTGETAGTFEDGHWKRGTCNVTVSTFQAITTSLRKHAAATLRFLAAIEAVNIDEVHAASASSYFGVLQAMDNCYYRVGQSATPTDRKPWDLLKIFGAVGPLAYEIKTETLIDAGVLSKPTITMCGYQHPPIPPGMDYRRCYNAYVVNARGRNELLADMVGLAEKPCLIFVKRYRHAANLYAILRARKLSVGTVSGIDAEHARENAVAALVAGEFAVIICTVVFQEGIDIPQLRSVVNGSGEKDPIATTQKPGRGMRTCAADGKDGFELWDVFDMCSYTPGVQSNGEPCSYGEKNWLEEHSKMRKRIYEKEGHEVKVVPCEWTFPSGTQQSEKVLVGTKSIREGEP